MNPSRAVEDVVLGSIIGRRYRLLHLTGEGTFSKIYYAVDEKGNNLPYAVKLLKSEESDRDTIRRFQQEVQLTQQLQHPNIVRIYSSGISDEGNPYLVTEFLEGGDLMRELELYGGTPVPFLRALNLIRFTARALGHAHARKILHRDIKPENILLTPARNIKISDFGIGMSLRFARQTLRNNTIGTPCYMAPEQIDGAEMGPWTDVYALGILSFELLTGKLPFDAKEVTQVIYQQCFMPTPSILFKGGGIPCWMEDIVHRACEKEPSRRYPDANTLLLAMETAFQADRMNYSLGSRLLYYVRPSGKACTYFTERGVPRKRLGGYLLLLFLAAAAFLFAASKLFLFVKTI